MPALRIDHPHQMKYIHATPPNWDQIESFFTFPPLFFFFFSNSLFFFFFFFPSSFFHQQLTLWVTAPPGEARLGVAGDPNGQCRAAHPLVNPYMDTAIDPCEGARRLRTLETSRAHPAARSQMTVAGAGPEDPPAVQCVGSSRPRVAKERKKEKKKKLYSFFFFSLFYSLALPYPRPATERDTHATEAPSLPAPKRTQ